MDDTPALEVVFWSSDVPGLTAFLEGVAGMSVRERHPGLAVLARDGARLQIHADEAYQGHPWHEALTREGAARGIGTELRVRVVDVLGAYSEALKRGGIALQPPFDDDGTRECQVMGPDGFVLSLWEPISDGPAVYS